MNKRKEMSVIKTDAIRKDPIPYLRGRQAELAQRYGIRSIRFFGSRVRGDAGPDSDLDILIEADKPYRFDLLELKVLEQEFSDELGIPVDLVLDEDLKASIGQRVRAEAVPI